jgi:hypothetical protein
MLGFRGHFCTKSRAYSITLSSLRADRAAHQREQAKAAGLMPDIDGDTTLVLNHWNFAGRGHPPPADLLAAAVEPHVPSLPQTGGAPCPASC